MSGLGLKKKARDQRAQVVFIDESGLLLSPLVRRTQAPCGHPPVLKVRIRYRQKVSVAGALVLDPQDQQVRLFHWAYLNKTVSTARSARHLQNLRDRLARPMIVVWDRSTIHQGDPIRNLLARNPDVSIESLPPYAPDLNPVEQLWSYEKYGRLANFAPETAQQLKKVIQRDFRAIKKKPDLLKSLWKGASLPGLSDI